MANTNLSKTDVYESLYLISLATQQITQHLERLKAAKCSEGQTGRTPQDGGQPTAA